MTKTRTSIVSFCLSYCLFKMVMDSRQVRRDKIKPDCVQRNRNIRPKKKKRVCVCVWHEHEIKMIVVDQLVGTFYNLYLIRCAAEFHGHEWFFHPIFFFWYFENTFILPTSFFFLKKFALSVGWLAVLCWKRWSSVISIIYTVYCCA